MVGAALSTSPKNFTWREGDSGVGRSGHSSGTDRDDDNKQQQVIRCCFGCLIGLCVLMLWSMRAGQFSYCCAARFALSAGFSAGAARGRLCCFVLVTMPVGSAAPVTGAAAAAAAVVNKKFFLLSH